MHVIHDVTLKRQLEQAKQQVTAMITHDLRMPLQSAAQLSGDAAAWGGRGVEKPTWFSDLLDLTEQESQRMTELIDSVLELEKLRSGDNGTLERQPVPLADILPKSVGCSANDCRQPSPSPLVLRASDLSRAGRSIMARAGFCQYSGQCP